MSALKEELYRELEFKSKIIVEGVNIDFAVLDRLKLGTEYQEQIHTLFEMDHVTHVGVKFPCYFTSPNGINYQFNWDPKSHIRISFENGEFILWDGNELKFPVKFLK